MLLDMVLGFVAWSPRGSSNTSWLSSYSLRDSQENALDRFVLAGFSS